MSKLLGAATGVALGASYVNRISAAPYASRRARDAWPMGAPKAPVSQAWVQAPGKQSW